MSDKLFSYAFTPGQKASDGGILSRFIPSIPIGAIQSWLTPEIPLGSWVLDPFGSSPMLPVEAARLGYRVLVSANNPIDRLLLEIASNPPDKTDLVRVLASLSSLQKGNERLEPYIRSLYLTQCEICHREIQAEAYIWKKNAAHPSSKIYQCSYCGHAGEFPATQADIEQLDRITGSGLHRARLLERVATLDDPDRVYVEEALDIYLPRALNVLITLINKIDGLEPEYQHLFYVLLLAAFDQANSLWHHPAQKTRPRQLVVPSQFRENNIWFALENTINNWDQIFSTELPPVKLTTWPTLPPHNGGICLFPGRLKDVFSEIPEKTTSISHLAFEQIKAVLGVLPRPNQAYWTLSTLWAGWLWGREAAAPFKLVLHRRRYDWSWHSDALNSTFSSVSENLSDDIPFFTSLPEAEPGFISAALLAASHAGFDLDGIALRVDPDLVQIRWRVNRRHVLTTDLPSQGIMQAKISSSGINFLRQIGEPTDYLHLHAAILADFVEEPDIKHNSSINPSDILAQMNSVLSKTLGSGHDFSRFNASSHSLEVGQWWLRDIPTNDPSKTFPGNFAQSADYSIPGTVARPLSDRIEIEIVRSLVSNPLLTWSALDEHLCAVFPGLSTPDTDFIQTCLESYSDSPATDLKTWQLRLADKPAARRADLQLLTNLIIQIGWKLGFHPSQDDLGARWITWQKDNQPTSYAFYLTASAVFSHILNGSPAPADHSLIVYPGGRAMLINAKLRRNPYLRLAVDRGWRFVKFRHMRSLAESESLTHQNLDDFLALDPISNQDQQISFI